MHVVATAVAAVATIASVPPVPVTNPPRAQLSPLTCVTALDPVARNVSVTATMRPLKATHTLNVEFRLLEKPTGATTWTQVPGPGLGQWLAPTDPPTLGERAADVWNVNHPVADLAGPAAYRFSVSFRWLATRGRVLGTQTLTSAVCKQPELRPDLVVGAVTVTPTARRTRRVYTATISNTGATAASAVSVELNVDGTIVQKTIKLLRPHAKSVVKLTGPACNAATPASVTVDPADQIDVSTRAQAAVNVVCPPAAGLMNGTPVR